MVNLIDRQPLRVVLTLPFVILILATGGLISYLTFQNGQRAVNQLAGQLHTEVTARIQQRLDSYLATPQLINQLNLDSVRLQQLDVRNLDAMEQHFLAQIQRFDSVISLAYADEQQEYVGASRKVLGIDLTVARASEKTNHSLEVYAITPQGGEPVTATLAYDPRSRPWYQMAIQAGQPAWTPIFLWSSGDVGVDAVVPVYSGDHRLVGVLDTSLTLKGIGEFLQGLQISKHGETFIMDKSGLLVAASTIKEPFLRRGNDVQRLSALESGDPVAQAATRSLEQQFGALANITTSHQFYFDLPAGRQFAQITPYRDAYGLDWLIVTVIPESDFMAQIDANNRSTALLIAMSLLSSIIIAVLMARWIAQPLVRLSQSAKALAHGDWTHTVVVDRGDEVGELARAFSHMAEQLRESFASLQASEARYRGLFEGVPVGIYRTTPAGAILDANPASVRLLGYPDRESLHAIEATDLYVHPEDRQQWQTLIEHDGRIPVFEVRLRRPDGAIIWVRSSAQAVRDADGQVLYYEGSLEDITERKRAEDDLKQYRDQLEALVESRTAELTIAKEQAEAQNAQLQQEISERRQAEAALQRAHAKLEQRVAERTAALAQANASLKAEIAERKQAEEQLRQAQKMEAIGRLAGGIAHDFNNLLTVILGNVEMLLKAPTFGDDLRQDTEQIRKAADRATALTRQLLAFSRQQVLEPRRLDLNTVVADMGQLLRRLIGEDIELVTRLAPDLGPVHADPGQIEQVIMNLAVNARDAMPAGGKLIIATANAVLSASYTNERGDEISGPYVLLAVTDTGIGMDAQTLSRVFEPFFTTKEPGKGTGLGLATVYGIVQQSGGHIEVESQPGRGTTFKFYLPQVAKPPQPIQPSADLAAPHGTGTILLVEDEPGVRELARRVLIAAGYQVLVAGDGATALHMAEAHPGAIDLLLTDVVIPGGINGRQLAERLLAQRPGLYVLYMSGYTDDTMMRHGVGVGESAFLQKPFTPKALVGTVEAVFRRHAGDRLQSKE